MASSSGEPSPARILVVDDDPEVAKSIASALRKHYRVCVVYTGLEAIKESRRHQPDLIILDVVMPDMDGLETCRQLRLDPAVAGVPILFLTALGRPEDRIAGFRVGADDYLTKPFNLEELMLRIKAILRRVRPGTSASAPTLCIKNLVLDKNSYEVTTHKKQAKLTPAEFDILYHLMLHPHEAFSSHRLFQEVWHDNAENGSPEAVRMHIKNLRQKIEADPGRPEFILTIPRRGYTISD